MKQVNLELHIEELVLHGISPGDRQQLSEAFQRELVQLISGQGVPPSIASGDYIKCINAGTFKILPGAKSETIGVQVAQSVYGGLSR